MREPKWISAEALQLLHAQQLERFGGKAGIIDYNAIESARTRPQNLFAYGGDAVDLADLAAAYLCGLGQKQGFADGNKRTALAATLVFLSINGRPLHVASAELYAMTMKVVRNELGEQDVAEWLRSRI